MSQVIGQGVDVGHEPHVTDEGVAQLHGGQFASLGVEGSHGEQMQ